MFFVQRALSSSPFRSTDMSYHFFVNVALCGMFLDCDIYMVSIRNATRYTIWMMGVAAQRSVAILVSKKKKGELRSRDNHAVTAMRLE